MPFLRPLITAHRGLSGLAPENTVLAFSEALEFNCDFIETDVWQTKDGQIVCIHDADLRRTTDRQGDVRGLTLAEVREADAGQGERVPTLDEALEVVGGRCVLTVEMKMSGIEEQVVHTIRAHAAMRLNCTLGSFDAESVRRARAAAPELAGEWITAPGGPVGREAAVELAVRALEVNASTLSVLHSAVTEELVREAHLRGLDVAAWTVNDAGRMLELAEMGVDRIITDRCDLAVGALRG